MDNLAEEILEFWQEIGPEGWYAVSDDIDDLIRTKYLQAWQDAMSGKLKGWQNCARSSLALILVLDQFSRNMFRGRSDSFASDRMARCVAQKAILRDFDLEVHGDIKQFFYLPFMHSESIVDQDMAVRSFLTRMPGTSNLFHARAHRQVIRDFGRFPFRNQALERNSTVAELAYLDAGGYGHTVQNLEK